MKTLLKNLYIMKLDKEEIREMANQLNVDYVRGFLTGGPRIEFKNDRKVGYNVATVKLYKSCMIEMPGYYYPEELDFLIKTLKRIRKELRYG